MEIKWIQQDNSSIFGWKCSHGISVRGYAYTPEGEWLQGDRLAAFFADMTGEDMFADKVRSLNGCFAVIVITENIFACSVDRLRSFPIFYNREEGKVTDHLEADPTRIEAKEVPVFKALYFTEGRSTLLKGWEQLMGGEYLWSETGELRPAVYYMHADAVKWTSKDLHTDLINRTHASVMKRQVASTAGRPVAILLSGGYDSRWLLAEWRIRHKGPLYAITYGKSRSYDTLTAEQVARTMQVKWLYVPYSPALLDDFGGKDWEQYSRYSHQAVSTPYEQDYFALKYIREQQWIPDDTIIIPGFCGDLLGGSIFDVFRHDWSVNGLTSFISGKYGVPIVPFLPPSLKIADQQSFWDAWQHWFVVNRVSKFLVHGVQAYSFLGYEWRLPLWDNELMELWYKVPLKKRINQQLYEDWLFGQAFRALELDEWEKPGSDANTDNRRWKAWLKSILPKQFVSRYKEKQLASGRYDPNNLLYLYRRVNDSLKDRVDPDTYNFNDAHSRSLLENLWDA